MKKSILLSCVLAFFVGLSLVSGCPATPTPQDGGDAKDGAVKTDSGPADDRSAPDDRSTPEVKPDAPACPAPDEVVGYDGKPCTSEGQRCKGPCKNCGDGSCIFIQCDKKVWTVVQPNCGPKEAKPEPRAEPAPEPRAEPAPEPRAEPTTPDAGPEPTAEPAPERRAEPAPERRANPEPHPDQGALTCKERLDKSQNLVQTALNANLTCAQTTDCTTVNPATGCRGACPVGVNTGGKAKVEAAIKKSNQMYCSTYRADGCPYATPRCVNGAAVCDNKKCVFATCTDRRNKARNGIQAIVQANQDCQQDTDCVAVFTSTGCAGACQSVVNKTGEARLKAAIADYNAGICYNYRQDGCPYATPSCAAIKVKCVNKVCTGVR